MVFSTIHHKKRRPRKPVEQLVFQLFGQRQRFNGGSHALQPGYGVVFSDGVGHVAGAHHGVTVYFGVELRAAEELGEEKALLLLNEVFIGFEKARNKLVVEYEVVKFIGELPERRVAADALV